MANTSRVVGLRPIRHLSGSPWNGALEVFYHSTADANAIYKGGLVVTDVGLATPGTDPLETYGSVVTAADDDADILGVAWTFGTTRQIAAQVNNLNAVNYCPASTGMYIGCIVDPTVIYEIEDNGTTLTASQIGQNADTSSNASGSATTGRSSCVLDQDTLTAGSATLRILRLVDRPDNVLGANAKWEVMINESIYRDAEPATT